MKALNLRHRGVHRYVYRLDGAAAAARCSPILSGELGCTRSGSTTYAAAVSMAPGPTVKMSFPVSSGWYCDSTIGVMFANGTKYQTPATHC